MFGVTKIDRRHGPSLCASLRWINATRRPIYDGGIVKAETRVRFPLGELNKSIAYAEAGPRRTICER
jgi:hypothetical protein